MKTSTYIWKKIKFWTVFIIVLPFTIMLLVGMTVYHIFNLKEFFEENGIDIGDGGRDDSFHM